MPILTGKKIDGIKPMLMQYFPNNSPVSEEFLRKKVEEDIIEIAVKEGFICLSNGLYRRTEKGRNYRNG